MDGAPKDTQMVGCCLQLCSTMPIPELDDHGLLPVGVHECTWTELQSTFCWNSSRQALYNSLQQFLLNHWQPLNIQASLWVDGSFTRRKELPQDIDIVADVSHLTMHQALPAFKLWFQQPLWKQTYHVDFWVKHPSIHNDLTQFFQYVGLKAGAELSLDTKRVKGILRIL